MRARDARGGLSKVGGHQDLPAGPAGQAHLQQAVDTGFCWRGRAIGLVPLGGSRIILM